MKWKVFGFNADGKITVTVKANSFDEALEKARKLYDGCMVGAQKFDKEEKCIDSMKTHTS